MSEELSSPETGDSLQAVLRRHELPLSAEQIGEVERYCHLLWQWNQQLNLTRHTTYEKFVSRDVVDSWQLAQLLSPGEEVLDVGTGGGVPGILLAIICPQIQVTLCDSVKKKAKVVDAIVEELGLQIPVHHVRAEELLDDFRFDTLVARAVGPLWKILHWFRDSWASIGQILAIKGPRWVEERKEARHRGLLSQLELRRVASYPMVDTESESVILRISRAPSSTTSD